MFELCETQQGRGSFSKRQNGGAGRIHRGLVFFVAILLSLSASWRTA